MKIQKDKLKYNVKRLLNFFLPVKLRMCLRNIHARINTSAKKRKTIKLIPRLTPLESKNSPQYIVSLTSYGKRLTDTAPFAIVTLLNQTIKPDRVILWVANEDKESIPKIMGKLTEKGLEIRFCEDIKSYKKLIPALKSFPRDYIITADDDIFYPQNWLEQLLGEHKKTPHKIICHRAHGIKVDEGHNPIPYTKWDYSIKPRIYFSQVFISQQQSVLRHQLESVFPTGSAGILYPPKCFHADTMNKNLFMNLAPYADDIWFWAMAVMNKEHFGEDSPYIVIAGSCLRTLSLIDPRQEKNGNALANYNWSKNGNDKQLKAIIEQYPQIMDVLRKIEKYSYGILTPCGFAMKLDTTDWIQKQIYEKGCYEKSHVLALLSLLPPEGIFFDIGANVGVYSLNLSKKAKSVYSFEATKKTYEHLLETISMNKIKNVHHNFYAVHHKSGLDIEIWTGKESLGNDNNGNNGMFGRGRIANIVQSITIDGYINNNNIDKIDVIKIDIEGNELNALKGASESIQRFRPIILCEMNPEMNKMAGYTTEELLNYFIDILCYIPTFFIENKFLIANKNNIMNAQSNIFFFPKEKPIP